MTSRNEIPIPNSNSQCLIENWFEERTTKILDGQSAEDRLKNCKFGHPKILYIDSFSTPDSVTHKDFKNKQSDEQPTLGTKGKLIEQETFQQIYSEVDAEYNAPPEPTEFKSVTAKDFFTKECPKKEFKQTRPIHLTREQPITFWTEHTDRMHGISQLKTFDTPFRKNAAFSTPVENHWNSTRPYELSSYPKM